MVFHVNFSMLFRIAFWLVYSCSTIVIQGIIFFWSFNISSRIKTIQILIISIASILFIGWDIWILIINIKDVL